jgi:hypothetical protein
MGSYIKKQISPNDSASPEKNEKNSSLLEWRGVVSRANFSFLSIIDTYGIEN